MQFTTPFSDRRYLVPVRRYSRSNRKIRNFDVFGPPNFLGEGPPKFLTHIYKLQSPSNMWQSLVTIGPETSEISRRKKKRIETSAVKYNGRRPASWRTAIKCYGSAEKCMAAVKTKYMYVHQAATVQRPCLSPSYCMTKSDEQKLESFQISCLRRILGIRWFDFVLNMSVMNQTQQQSIRSRIRDRRISTFGHVPVHSEERSVECHGISNGPVALSQSIPDFRTWMQHTHKFWCYPIATVTIIYVLHGNKSLILTLILTLTLNPIYC